MALLTSADKALWRLALPMIFSILPFLCLGWWIRRLSGISIRRFISAASRSAQRRPAFSLCCCFSAHEYDGPDGPGVWCKDPLRLARALVQPLILAFGAGALIVLLRTPLIDLALHIVGGSDAVLEQARRFLEIRWLSAPASLANWSCWAGCWACSTPARR